METKKLLVIGVTTLAMTFLIQLPDILKALG